MINFWGNDPMSISGGSSAGLTPVSDTSAAKTNAAAETVPVSKTDPSGKPLVDDRTSAVDKGDKTEKTGECQTCKNRRYQDGSNEMVSYKSPTHISPESAASAVMSHEQEHVSNAYKKASLKGGKVLQASVSIHTAVCPECGRVYVCGGTTTTRIKYGSDDNPYEQNAKSQKSTENGSFVNTKV